MFQENKALQIFRKTNISYPWNAHDTCTCAYQGVRNVCFSENLDAFVFLKHPFWVSLISLFTRQLLGGRSQVCFLSNQIAGFFDHKYLWKKTNLYLNFWVWPVVSLVKSNSRIFWSVLSRKWTNKYLDFCRWGQSSRNGHNNQGVVASKTTTMVGSCQACLSSNQIAGFFDQHYHCKEPINILIFVDEVNLQGTDIIIKGW